MAGIGIVKEIIEGVNGTVEGVLDGVHRTLHPGSKLLPGEEIVTTGDSAVRVEFANKTSALIVPNQQVVLDQENLVAHKPDPADSSVLKQIAEEYLGPIIARQEDELKRKQAELEQKDAQLQEMRAQLLQLQQRVANIEAQSLQAPNTAALSAPAPAMGAVVAGFAAEQSKMASLVQDLELDRQRLSAERQQLDEQLGTNRSLLSELQSARPDPNEPFHEGQQKFINIAYEDPRTQPDSGYDTIGIGFTRLPPDDVLILNPEQSTPPPPDHTPRIVDVTPGVEGGDVRVEEDDLPGGSDQTPESVTQQGDFRIVSQDGVASLTIGGQTVIENGALTANTSIVSPYGVLTITGYNPATGLVTYSYQLTNPAQHAPGDGNNSFFDDFPLVLTDNDGDQDSDVLSVNVIDDVPVAVNDVDTIPRGEFGPATGNVMTDAEGDGGGDLPGADGAQVTAIAANNPGGAPLTAVPGGGVTIAGQYGNLTINPDGNYSYTRNPGTPGGVNDVFTYTLTDGDLDNATATLTITILNASPDVEIPPGDNLVDEDDLPNGSDTTKEGLTHAGEFTIQSPDGMASLTIGGETFITNGVFTAGTITTGLGNTLAITSYDPITHVISYEYTLSANESHPLGQGQNILPERFEVVLTDQDGQSISSAILAGVIDDVPEAANDEDSIAAGGFGPATGNVISDAEGDGGADVQGADGAQVSAVASINVPANSDDTADVGGNFQLSGQYGVLTLNQDGGYSYVRNAGTPGGVSDVFTYTLTDGDGDNATATLTIAIGNTPPNILDLNPADNGGDVTLNESHLPGGTSPDANALTQPGSFTIASPDGIGALTVGGLAIITNGVFAPGTITTGLGNTFNITAYDPATGTVSYTYTLNGNENHPGGAGTNSLFENLPVTLTDLDGESASATLSVNIIDDVPTAANDTDLIASGTFGPATGNVMTDAEGDGGADTQGADGARVNSVTSNNVPLNSDNTVDVGGNLQLNGQYGVLTLNQDGNYSYTRNDGTPGGVSDVFNYTLLDGDGDTANATLTIAIGDATPEVIDLTPESGGGDVIVNESHLPNGSDPNPGELSQPGSFTVKSPDGIDSLVIGGQPVITDGVFTPVTITTGTGNTLQITAIDPVTGKVDYIYTLTGNEPHPDDAGQNNLFDKIPIVVTDRDGDPTSNELVVNIVDDVPDAVNDTDTIPSGTFGPATGNVITDAEGDGGRDQPGADGAVVTAITSAAGGPPISVTPGGVTIPGQYGNLTIAPDGTYSYVRNPGSPGDVDDVFTYTLTDGDGDADTATLTISIISAPPVISNLTPANNGGDVIVDEDDLPSGSDATKESLTQPGDFTVLSPDGIANLTIGGQAFITDNVFTAGSVTSPLGNTLNVTGYNPVTGVISYTFTLTGNENHALGLGENSLFENFAVVVTDRDGQAANDTLVANIVDDVPSITGNAVDNSGLLLNTQDADTIGPNTDTATASFANAFQAAAVPQFGADGSGGVVLSNYALSVTDASSGLTSGGLPINLYSIGGQVVGSTAANAGGVNEANSIFSLSVDNGGTVTLSQFAQLDHVSGDGARLLLATGHVSLGATATATDGDGDTASTQISTDLGGGVIAFDDDVPQLLTSAINDSLQLTTFDSATIGANTSTASASFAAAFLPSAPNFGADGPAAANASITTYALEVSNPASGLTSNGSAIFLYLIGGAVVGSTAATEAAVNNANTIFDLNVDVASGLVTQNQYQQVDHGALGSSADTLRSLANNRVELTATTVLTDFDGDTATSTTSLDMGGNMRFMDSTPTVGVALDGGVPLPVLSVQDAALVGNASDSATSTANFGGVFTFTSNSGGDNFDAAGVVTSYSFSILNNGAGSGLSHDNTAVRLFTVDTNNDGQNDKVVGSTALTLNGVNSGNTVFDVAVDNAGVVTLTQYQTIDHAPGSQTAVLSGVTFSALVGATDFDGDIAAPASAAIGNFGLQLHFEDSFIGSPRNDVINGGVANDAINGNGGDDILSGGPGSDTLTGGVGSDTFAYASGDVGGGAVDHITDFETTPPTPGVSGDVLNIADLLVGFGGSSANDAVTQGFLQFTSNGGATAVQVDTNGSSGGASFQTIAVLDTVAFTDAATALNQLQDNIAV